MFHVVRVRWSQNGYRILVHKSLVKSQRFSIYHMKVIVNFKIFVFVSVINEFCSSCRGNVF